MLRVKNIMNTTIETIPPNVSLNQAMKQMLIKDIHHLLVVEDQRLVGLLSVRDLDAIGNEQDREGLQAGAAMITHMITAAPEMTIPEAADLMCSRTIGCLPIVENGKPIGIVTTSDMLALLAKTGNQIQLLPERT